MSKMVNHYRVHPWLRVTGFLLAIIFLSSCSSVMLLKGRPGTDVSSLDTSATRQDVEQLVGDPVREWQSIRGVKYARYEFDGGVPPHPGYALMSLFFGVGTAGTFEVFLFGKDGYGPEALGPSEIASVIISYDADGNVLGVFAEDDSLPPDGIVPIND